MIIRNYKKINTSVPRQDALEIIKSAYGALNIEKLIKERVKLIAKNKLCISDLSCEKIINLDDYKKVFLIGFGKGSYLVVSKISDIIGSRISTALALDVKNSCYPQKINKKVRVLWGSHPKPSLANVRATQKIISVLKSASEKDLVIFFVGGGGSSLLCGSKKEFSDSKSIFDQLTKKGIKISELNIIRKHLSEVKGGGLAKIAFPAHQISLIVSDVCGNDLAIIASGPTIYDKTTSKDAKKIIEKYLGRSASTTKLSEDLLETPKEKGLFENSKYFLLACNEDGALAMKKTATSLGYKSSVIDLAVQDNALSVFDKPLSKIKNGECLIMAGETTVNISGSGIGGRNQHSCLSQIAKGKIKEGILISSFASDCFDNTSFAGAIVDCLTIKESKKLNLNSVAFLKNCDSYSFFHIVGDYLLVDKKSFNVSDFMLVLKQK